jgi:hypothetical protein
MTRNSKIWIMAGCLCVIGGAAVLGYAEFGGIAQSKSATGAQNRPDVAAPKLATVKVVAPATGIRALSAKQQLNLAMRAIFPGGVPQRMNDEGEVFIYGPGKLIWAPFGPVLIAPADNENAAPVTTGALGIFYLKEERGAFVVVKSWPEEIEGSIIGNPPEWEVSDTFGDRPVIVSKAGGVWQGIACQTTTVHELHEVDGPRIVAIFPSLRDDSGYQTDDAMVTSVKGKIENVVPNTSFDVRFQGSQQFVAHFVKRSDAYVRTDRGPAMPDCG